MKSHYVASRVLKQIVKDKRLLAMMFIAPVLVLLLLKVILTSSSTTPTIALVAPPASFQAVLEKEATLILKDEAESALSLLQTREADAVIDFSGPQIQLTIEGADSARSQLVAAKLQKALLTLAASESSPAIKTLTGMLQEPAYLHGSKDYKLFERISPLLMGFLIFFYVFVTAGISFLRERISGTLDRLLATPLKRSQIVLGYFLGFGGFVCIQTIIIQTFGIYVLEVPLHGSFWSVMLIDLLLSTVALSLGLFLSAYSRNEFQLFQFIPIVIVPQVLFSGMFDLSEAPVGLQWLSKCFPLTYAARALGDVMLRGYQLHQVIPELLVMAGFSAVFLLLNASVLKKYRKI